MGYGKVLRERVPAIRFLVEAQKTVWYPILFAVICIISGSCNRFVYLPLIAILCSFVIFSVLFTDDNKVFLVPILMIYYSMGMDEPLALPGGATDQSLLSSFSGNAFTVIIICGSVTFCAFIARMIADGSVVEACKHRSFVALGILILDAAFLTNGLLNPNYPITTFLYGLIICAAITVFFFLGFGMLKNSKEIIPYTCKIMVCTAYVALFQFFIKACWLYQKGLLFYCDVNGEIVRISRYYINLSWGLSTQIAAVFVLGIPAAMYLARNGKRPVLSYLSALAFLLGTVLINTRSAMLVGAVAFVVCSVLSCIKNQTKPKNVNIVRAFSVVFVICITGVLIAILAKPGALMEILYSLRFSDHDDSPRLKLWELGLEHFFSSPVFGSGFDTGSNIDNNVFSSMYHCFPIQIIGSMGVIGAIAAMIHLVSLGRLALKRASVNKFLLLMLPLMILGMSLVDNFFFYPNFQIFYAIFVLLAEYSDAEKRDSLINSQN